MKSVVFVKWSERLPGKHHLQICGRRMIDIVCEALKQSGLFDEIVIFSKDETMDNTSCRVVHDNSQGVLLDSIVEALREFKEFLAVGGDMPYIDSDLIRRILEEYENRPIAYVDRDGQIEPLFAIYDISILSDMIEYSKQSKAIYPFISNKFKLIHAGCDSYKLRSVNTVDDLEAARRIFGCH